MRTKARFKIRFLKTGFQPNNVCPWKNLSVGIPLPCEREGKFITVFGCQKIEARSKTISNPSSPRNELFKDRVLPLDRYEVRRCRSLGEFLKKPLARARIVVNTAVYPD